MSLLTNITWLSSATACAYIGRKLYKSWPVAIILALFCPGICGFIAIPISALLFYSIDTMNKLTGEKFTTSGETFSDAILLASLILFYSGVIFLIHKKKISCTPPAEPTSQDTSAT